MARKKKFTAGSYSGRTVTPSPPPNWHPQPKGISKGAVRQQMGLSYFPEPPRGFRLSDAGKQVLDPDNRTLGPIPPEG